MTVVEQYVEQYARARVVTDSPEAGQAVPVVLRHESGTVHVALPGSGEWGAFPRELLERGLRTPVTGGAVRIWPCGRVQTVIEFHAPHKPSGVTVVQFDTKALVRFLRRTYTTVTPAKAPQGVTR
ncbi:SsgA family sporulation/cell division regulator [Streptomyces sp. NBC_00356]|uniref:SsgA family sporulation/cell division regulator n=1 Tax=Streptomyces sp. NBC_00356 TaxID=2975724 RepID=UPI002E25B0D4